MVRIIAGLLLFACLILTACQPSPLPTEAQANNTPSPSAALTPYHTSTATLARPTPTIKVTIPVTPSPTSTPYLHTITDNDTMLGLAIHYGISLEAMKTANPLVIPNAMTVGSQLVIPVTVETPQAMPTATPVPVVIDQATCTKTGDGSAWCIVAIRNDSGMSLENMSVWIGLYDLQGVSITNQVAYSPLDILRPGAVMPVMAYFNAPLPDEFIPRTEILTASTIGADDQRYLDTEVKLEQVVIIPAESQVAVTGEVILPQDVGTPSQVWVLAVAYDTNGQIVGMRKWKSAGDTHFNITVYSLGGSIDRADVLTEVRP